MTDQLDVEALVELAERIPAIDRTIDYKYFGDYEMSDDQRDAVNACQDALHALPAILAHIAVESARVAEAVAAERERAAMIAIAFGEPLSDWDDDIAAYETAQLIAAAIRETPNAE